VSNHNRLPLILERVEAAGHTVFFVPNSANLVVRRGPGGPGDWDGMLHLVWRPSLDSGWIEHSWPCATRPAPLYLRNPMNPQGTLLLEPGQYPLSHRVGHHKGRPALVQVRPVTGRRDNNRDEVLDPGPQLFTGMFGANIHDIGHPGQLAGCVGLVRVHMIELLVAVDRLVKSPGQGEEFTLTLVED
jgi:hypothetical protein